MSAPGTLAEHTPGPWKTGREDMQSFDGETLEPFTNIYHETLFAGFHRGEAVPLVIGRAEGENNKANARLIAAAPQLLDSLLAVEFAGAADCDDIDGEMADCCPNCGAFDGDPEIEGSGLHTPGCELRDSLDAALGVRSARVGLADG